MLPPEEQVKGLDLYYTAVREKQKSKSGLITHEQAARAVANDIPKEWEQGLKELQSSLDLDLYELTGRLRSKDPLNPVEMEQAVEEIDRQLANIIKRWEPQDPSFEPTIISYNYNGNSKEFWELYNGLKKKDFL
jgi:hypothetical protein